MIYTAEEELFPEDSMNKTELKINRYLDSLNLKITDPG
jgi:hypothetical protein